MIVANTNIVSAEKASTWLGSVAIIFGILTIINALFILVKQKYFPITKEQFRSEGNKHITLTGIILYSILVFMFLAGITIPVIAPQSKFSIWITSGYVAVIYFILCAPIVSILAFILHICGFPITKSDR